MISIAEAISDLLFVRDVVVVPGLGAFVKKPVSAKVNPVANYFSMPSSKVVFDANLREDNELVVNYMSEKNDIPKEEAQKLLSMFVSDCFNSLKQGKKVVLNPIGTLSYDWVGDFVFEQDKSINYNADAFGLCDFTPEPVLRSKTKDEIKTEIEQQQKDKNTPMSVDERAVHERDTRDYEDEDEEPRRGLGWLWILLGLLLVAGILYGLYYFKVITFPWQKEKRPVVIEPKTYTLPTYEKTWEWKEPVDQDTTQSVGDTVNVPVEQQPVANPIEQPTAKPVTQPVEQPTVQPVGQQEAQPTTQPEQQPKAQPVAPQSDANIRIIAGCFGVEENAIKLTNTLKEKGYAGALYEMRYNMWYVSFGQYKTDEEAAAALREIRANTEYKAWIFKGAP